MNLSVKNIDKKISKVSNIFAKSIIPLSGDHTDSSHIVASKKNNFSTILQRFCNNFAAIFYGFSGVFDNIATIFDDIAVISNNIFAII